MRGQSRTRSLVLCGLSIALLSVGAFVTVPIPFGLMPFTLQTLAFFIILLILTPSEAVIAVVGYLVLGALGFPIFSGMMGGVGKLLGPTGGFLFGYVLAALAVGGIRVFMERQKIMPQSLKYRLVFDVSIILAACLIFFGLGTVWYSFNMGVSMGAAAVACVLPFVITEPLKIIAAVACATPIRSALGLGVVPSARKQR
ncbi:MAG: biotin transporter BioY [Coriobacteriales bacterium]|jgi:biotin transport system substrate-specific component|nr:biotin transporter BioY [Coriobacteriales bacterium]